MSKYAKYIQLILTFLKITFNMQYQRLQHMLKYILINKKCENS